MSQPSIDSLLDQFDALGGPEEYGAEGLAIMVALWRKSAKIGWKDKFKVTNDFLTVQTGIKSRDTINKYRKKLVENGLIINYSAPPRGSSNGEYTISLNLIVGEVVQKMDHFEGIASKVVQNSDHFADTKDLKDFKDLTTITTTDEESDGMIGILNAYCKLHNKLDLHVTVMERQAMGMMVAGGTPNPFTIKTMASLLEAKRVREGDRYRPPKSFLYYVDAINDAWNNAQGTANKPAPSGPILLDTSRRPNRKQQEMDDLRRRMEEERKREEVRSAGTAP